MIRKCVRCHEPKEMLLGGHVCESCRHPTHKTCSACKQHLEISLFNKDHARGDGHRGICRACAKSRGYGTKEHDNRGLGGLAAVFDLELIRRRREAMRAKSCTPYRYVPVHGPVLWGCVQ